MKKISALLLMFIMFIITLFGSIPSQYKDLPIYKGDVKKVIYTVIYEGDDFVVVIIDGVAYIVKAEQ